MKGTALLSELDAQIKALWKSFCLLSPKSFLPGVWTDGWATVLLSSQLVNILTWTWFQEEAFKAFKTCTCWEYSPPGRRLAGWEVSVGRMQCLLACLVLLPLMHNKTIYLRMGVDRKSLWKSSNDLAWRVFVYDTPSPSQQPFLHAYIQHRHNWISYFSKLLLIISVLLVATRRHPKIYKKRYMYARRRSQ